MHYCRPLVLVGIKKQNLFSGCQVVGSAGAVKEELEDVARLEAGQQARRHHRAGKVGRRVRAKKLSNTTVVMESKLAPAGSIFWESSCIRTLGASGASSNNVVSSVLNVVDGLMYVGHEHVAHDVCLN
jgi:hypothetical protein